MPEVLRTEAAVPAAVRGPGAVAHRRPRHARGAALRRARGRRQHRGGRARGRRAARALPRVRARRRGDLRPRRPPPGARSPPTSRGSWCRRVGGVLLVTDAASPLMLGVLAALYGTADAFFQPAFTGLLPADRLAPRPAAAGQRAARAELLGLEHRGPGAGRRARRRPSAPGAAMLFDAGSFAVSVACLLRLRPRGGGRGDRGGAAGRSSPRSRPAGARSAAARGCSPASARCAPTRASCCRPSTCSGPVSIAERLGGPGAWAAVVVAFGLGCVLGRPAAAAHPPAPRAADGRHRAHPRVEPGGGLRRRRRAGRHVRAAVRGRDRRDRVLHALGGLAAGAHPGRGALARELVRLPRRARSSCPSARRSSARSPPSLGTQETLLGMSAVGIACALGFLAVPGVRRLPRVEAAASRRSVAFPSVAETDNGERRRRPAILAVDDEPAVLAAVARDLRRQFGEGYRILRASSGQEGARHPARPRRARRPGGAAGGRPAHARACRAPSSSCRRARSSPSAKRVLLTAYADTEAAIQAINEVALDYYLLKPWDPPEEHLYPVVEDLLTTWASGAALESGGVRLIGHRFSRETHELRDFLARNRVPARWMDVERDGESRELLKVAGVDDERAAGGAARGRHGARAPDGARARRAPRRHQPRPPREHYDLVIVGGGPGGAGGRRLRRLGGPAHGDGRARGARRAGRAVQPDRELPRLPRRPERLGARAPRRPIRRAASAPSCSACRTRSRSRSRAPGARSCSRAAAA